MKAGGPTRASVETYAGPPPDMRFQFSGLALMIIGPALVVGRERRQRRSSKWKIFAMRSSIK